MKTGGLEHTMASRKRLWFLDLLLYSQGLTKKDAANLLNKSPQNLTYIFKEDNCKLSFVEDVSRILGFTTSFQIIERGKPIPTPPEISYTNPKRDRLSFIERAMQESGLTRKDILRKARINAKAYEQIVERGDISIDKIYRIAEALGGMVIVNVRPQKSKVLNISLNHKVCCYIETTPVNE